MSFASFFLSLFITSGNFWLSSTYSNIGLKLEALGARKRTTSYILGMSSFSIPRDVVKKNKGKLKFLRVREGRVNRLFMEKVPYYGDNEFIYKKIGVDFLHSKGLYGQGITIGVFDTGFDSTHPAINSIYREGRVISQYDFNSGDHLFLDGQEVFLSDSLVYINGFSIKDSFIVVSYVPIDILALNDNGYRMLILHNGTREVISTNERSIKPKAYLKQDTLFVVYEMISGGYMQIELIKRLPDGTVNRIPITSDASDHIFPDLSFKGDTLFVYYGQKNGACMAKLLGGNIIKKDTILHKEHITYLKVYDNRYLVYATYDSVGLYDIPNKKTIFTHYGINPGLNPKNSMFYYSDIDGTFAYNMQNGDVVNISKNILTSPPAFDGDSTMYGTFNDYSAYAIYKDALYKIHSGLSDLVDAQGARVLIRQRGDRDVMPDNKDDYNMHGTEMLSLIGGFWEGRITGIAPLANFILCKTERGESPQGNNFENVVEEDFWVEALEFAIYNNAQIVSSSLGYKDWYSKRELNGHFPVSSRMASKALSFGTLVVTAMGNEIHSTIPQDGDTSLVAPADAYNILAIGGCDTTCEEVANCSYGPSGDGRIKPELVAPFNAYWTKEDGTAYMLGGTSVSTALTAGFIASLWSTDPDMSASSMRTLLINNATQLNGYNAPNNITGYGRIDGKKAYNALSIKNSNGEDVEFLDPYPNPAKKSIHNEIILPLQFVHRGDGIIKVFTLNGKLVKTIRFYNRGPGILKFSLPIRSLSPGMYNVFCHTTFKSAKTKFIILP